jgi:integrase
MQIPLGKDPRFTEPPKAKPKEPPPEVVKAYHELMRTGGGPEERIISEVAEHYFTHLETSEENKRSARLHFRWFCDFLASDCTKKIGQMRAQNLKPYMLTEYLATKPHWKPNTRRFAITRILAALNYCEREGYIVTNPLKGYKRPPVERREKIPTDAELETLINASMPEFRDLLICMRELGTRPKELFTATIDRFDAARGILIVGNKLARQTGEKLRPVFLTDRARDIISGRIGHRTEGPIFLNKRGKGWDRYVAQQYIRRLRDRLGMGKHISLYGLRHLWASYAINQGDVNPALVALQAGWTDLRRLMRTYLHDDTEAMRRAMEKAVKRKEA